MDINDYDVKNILKLISEDVQKYVGRGSVANYIPFLAKANPKSFALTLIDKNMEIYTVGDDCTEFSIQSVSKVFTLTMALNLVDEEVWGRMDREPSGKAFDSLVHLEEHNGVPANPFVNSGAIVLADILITALGDQAVPEFLKFMRKVSGNHELKINQEVYQCEKDTGFKNYSFGHYIKSYGNIENDVDLVLDAYFQFCSLDITNIDLCRSFYFLMNQGVSILGQRVTTHRHCKRINSIMFTCGTYDEVGEFAYTVGLPVKSGVSGAIGGCLPDQYAVCVWSPELNKKGNSFLGHKALEALTTMLDKSYLS